MCILSTLSLPFFLSSCSAHSSNLSPTRFAYGQVTYKYTHKYTHTPAHWTCDTVGRVGTASVRLSALLMSCLIASCHFPKLIFPSDCVPVSEREREKDRGREGEGQVKRERESPQLADGHVQCSHVYCLCQKRKKHTPSLSLIALLSIFNYRLS